MSELEEWTSLSLGGGSSMNEVKCWLNCAEHFKHIKEVIQGVGIEDLHYKCLETLGVMAHRVAEGVNLVHFKFDCVVIKA